MIGEDPPKAVLLADCVPAMAFLEAESVDAIVCDPPYDLTSGNGVGKGFMSQTWDGTGVAFDPATWAACLRVLKPGGHLLAFGGSRTSHRMVCAIEDAGFEIRDSIVWIQAQGFPKSLNVSKAIDKTLGKERQVVGHANPHSPRTAMARSIYGGVVQEGAGEGIPITAPASEQAADYKGYGTALRPSNEPICLARKPLGESTVAKNVLANRTGALNIDATRTPTGDKLGGGAETKTTPQQKGHSGWVSPWMNDPVAQEQHAQRVRENVKHAEQQGRWPANVILDEGAAAELDAHDNSGPSRYFYCAKVSRAERKTGLQALPERRNTHPTVKPVALMRWLVRLVTPPGGLVLDPFCGSGTTGVACAQEGFRFLGVERDEGYARIAEARIAHYLSLQVPS